MIFILLLKFKKKVTKDVIDQLNQSRDALGKAGGKILGTYWTLGRYDTVTIVEAKDEKAYMKMVLGGDLELASYETMVAVTREEAVKMIG
jgi:uncharacterized protein with GYD domain